MVFSDYNTKFLDEAGVNHLIKELKEYMSGLATGDIDLSDYVTKSELQAKLDSLNINIDLSSYATKEELTTAINSIDLSAYATKDEIPSIDGLATTEYVDNAIEGIPDTDLSNYYTKDETYNKEEVDSLVANSGGSGGGNNSTTSGSGITYAYDTEIATGDTWIDGKPIYLRVFHVDALEKSSSTMNYSTYHTQDKFAENIISFDTRWVREDSLETYVGNVTVPLQPVSTSSSSVGTSVNNNIIGRTMWCTVQNKTTFGIFIARGSTFYNSSCDIFLRYTKI